MENDGNALRKLHYVAVVLVIPLIGLALAKFVVGLNNINNCPADNKIPEFMVESSCVEFFFDIVVGIVAGYLNVAFKSRVVALIFEHLTIHVIETTYVAKQYYYLHDGCNGAEKCCAQTFLEFALGVVITEWIWVSICFCIFVCFLIKYTT